MPNKETHKAAPDMLAFEEKATGLVAAAMQIDQSTWAFPPGFNVMNRDGWTYSIQTSQGWKQVKHQEWIVLRSDQSVDTFPGNSFNAKFTPL